MTLASAQRLVLVEMGQIFDLLLDVTEPGRCMARCHIAEHHESGMWALQLRRAR